MRYAKIEEYEVNNGHLGGQSLYVQGCRFRCPNCFNPETWDFNGGKKWTPKIKKEFIELANRPYIKRISLLGGECLAENNITDVTKLAKKCKKIFPDKEIWLWSGFDFKTYISKLEIIEYVDYIIDGRYIEELKDNSLLYRGSSNQNIWKKENGEWCISS